MLLETGPTNTEKALRPYFIARQPIFDSKVRLFAYELLFRTSQQNSAPLRFDENQATADVITTSAEIGLGNLTGGHLGFINLPQQFLTNPDLIPISPEGIMLELLETITLNEESIDGIRTLHERGFRIALDDYIDHPDYEQVLPLIDTVKLDIQDLPREQWARMIERLRGYNCKILAEKVETHEEFEALKALGVDYYQGYFFAKPKVISGKRMTSNKIALLQLLATVNDPESDIEELHLLISRDVALGVRALSYVNSVANGLRRRIESIREAVVYLGRRTIKQWVILYMMASVDDKPSELLTLALVRAKLCELIGQRLGQPDIDSFFTIGLFSILDSLMDSDLETILGQLAITTEMEAALLHEEGIRGEVLHYAKAVAAGNSQAQNHYGIDQTTIAQLYADAISWTDASLRDMRLRA